MKVIIFKVEDETEERIEELSLLISEEKRQRINKFNRRIDKLRAIYGELIIAYMVMKEKNIKNKHISFTKNKYGKPFLKGYNNLHFNISHSEEYVVCALSSNNIGIDIEKIQNIDFEAISKQFFSEQEQKYILGNNEIYSINPLNRFYNIWTLKESYIKFLGIGMSMELNKFSLNINENGNIELKTNVKSIMPNFKIIEFNKEYKMSVCFEESDEIDVKYINKNKLLNSFRYIIQVGGRDLWKGTGLV